MGIKDANDIKNPYLKWLRKHIVVLVGFMGFGSYEGAQEFYDQQVENGIRHHKVDEVIEKIYDDRIFDYQEDFNKEQVRRIAGLSDSIRILSKRIKPCD